MRYPGPGRRPFFFDLYDDAQLVSHSCRLLCEHRREEGGEGNDGDNYKFSMAV